MPMVDPDGDEEFTSDHLVGIYNTILNKDVQFRLGVHDPVMLNNVCRYIMSNIGNITSSNSISENTDLSPVTVRNYLRALEEAYIIYKAYRYDIRGKKLLKKKIIIIFIMLFTLSGCSSSTSNKTDDITETKTFLYNYDYETDSNGEVHTDYHEEKPSVDLNESHEEVEPTVNFKKGAVTYVKMNETYNSGACECTVLKAYSTVSKQFCADTFGEEYSQLLLDYLNKFRGYYDENGNLFNEGHRFFLVKMHLKYSGKTTSKIQFTSPIICKYPDGTYYSLGLLGFIDRALSENSTCHLTLNPDDEFDAWFLYEASRYSHDKTYYLRGSFQNYIDDDSYTGYLVELNDIEDVE